MAVKRSKRIIMFDKNKINLFNKETMKYYKRYNQDLVFQEKRPSTIKNYEYDLFNFFTFLLDDKDNMSALEIDDEDIFDFLFFCKQRGNNGNRMKRRCSSISAFYLFLRKKKYIKENPMEFIDRPKKVQSVVEQTYLTEEQVKEMFTKLDELGDLQLEVYARLSLSTMGRVNAISNITWNQINFENRIISNVIEKEGYEVEFSFNTQCCEKLKQLKQQREENNINCDYVFISRYGGNYDKVTVKTLNDWCKRIGKMINVESLHPHDFRHSGATLLKNRGASLEQVSKMLNHAGTDVTSKFYIKEDNEKLQRAKDKFELNF